MVMDEALRIKDYPTYRQGIEMGYSSLEKCYVHVKGITSMSIAYSTALFLLD